MNGDFSLQTSISHREKENVQTTNNKKNQPEILRTWFCVSWVIQMTVVSQPLKFERARVVGDWQMFPNIAMCSAEQENKHITETDTKHDK